jgi:hypothetical protein
MIDQWWLWLVGIIVVAVLVFFAIRSNYNVEVSAGKHKFSFKRPVKEGSQGSQVDLLNKAELEDVEADNVVGAKVDAGIDSDIEKVRVLEKAKMKSSKMGNIIGMEVGGKKDKSSP